MNVQELLDKLTCAFDHSPAVDSEYRGITEDILYQDNIKIIRDEEVEVVRLSPDFVIYKNENNVWRFLKYSDQQGAGGNDLYTRVGSDTLFSSEYDRNNATLGTGVYNYAEFHDEAYNKIKFLKSGTYATGYFDLKSLENSKISSYSTDNLPANFSNGALAFNTTILEHVYFLDGSWYKLSDKSLVIDLTSSEGNWVMPNTVLWLDASDTSTVTHNSEATQRVSEWRDKSGNDYHASQSTVSHQFAYNTSLLNGKNTMAGETNRAMRSSGPTSATFRDVFIVARWDGGDNFNNFNALFTGGLHDNDNQGIQGANTNKKLFDNNPFFNRIILNGSVHSIADDILDIMKTPFIINVSDTRVVDRLVSGYAVGADRTLISREWTGIIAEIVVFDNVLEDADRIAMEGFLAHKWGLTNNLPSDHTYQSEEP